MSTFYIAANGSDKNAGTKDKPWQTFAYAASRVKSGDTVLVRSGTYHEVLEIKCANTTWRAEDPGRKPILDGGYNESSRRSDHTMPPPNAQKTYLPGSEYGKMIMFAADNVTVEGFEVRNVAGQPVGIVADNAKLLNCVLDFAYGGGINVDSVRSPLIENVRMTNCNQKRYDPKNVDGGPANVQVNLLFKKVEGGVIRGCEIAYNHGEGIGIAVESKNCIVENNILHTNLHMHIVLNHAQNNIIRNNFIYHLKNPEFLQRSSGDAPVGIMLADEMGRNEKLQLQRSEGNLIYNNIVVGMSQNFVARETKNCYGALRNTRIFNNTFVNAQRKNAPPINVRIPPTDQHLNSAFENNLILQEEGVICQAAGGNDIVYRNNLWSREPPAAAKGPGDKIGDPRLQNPRSFPPTAASYKLTAQSTLAIDTALKENILEDFFRAKRDGKPDIGAHEYSGRGESPSGAAPKAEFKVGRKQKSGNAPHTVNFTNQSTGEITAWSWKFGVRKGTSTEANPEYTYTKPGVYDVTLTVTDSAGRLDTIQKLKYIIVRGGKSDAQASADFTSEFIPEGESIMDSYTDGVQSQASNGSVHFSVGLEEFRRFVLYDIESEHTLAVGIQFPDLHCVLRWAEDSPDDPPYIVHYDNIEEVRDVHFQPDVTALKWLDLQPTE